ncbi:MAG: leucine-rich repeat domain-containing protein [Promethearchaeota archaeon]
MELKVNQYLDLRLEGDVTSIYVGGKKFIQCKHLLIQIPKNKINEYNTINSIDEVSDRINRSLSGLEDAFKEASFEIDPEEEFWGHCSNIQVWVENNYDSRLLHSNLAFPLLRELSLVGDPKARVLFKNEIAKRFSSKYLTTMLFIIEQGYLDIFSKEELEILFHDVDFTVFLEVPSYYPEDIIVTDKKRIPEIFRTLIQKNIPKAEEFYTQMISTIIYNHDYTSIKNLLINDYFDILERSIAAELLKNIEFSKLFDVNDISTPEIFKTLFKYRIAGAYESYKSLIIDTMALDDFNSFSNLILHRFIDLLKSDDIKQISQNIDYEDLVENKEGLMIIKRLISLGVQPPKTIYKQYIKNLVEDDQINDMKALWELMDANRHFTSGEFAELFENYNFYKKAREDSKLTLNLIDLLWNQVSKVRKLYCTKEFIQNYIMLEEIPAFLELNQIKFPFKMILYDDSEPLRAYSSPYSAHISTRRILGLNLNRANISSLPNSIKKINYLEQIQFKCNQLRSLSKIFKDLKTLKIVDVSFNKLDLFPNFLFYNKGLLELDLKVNNISFLPNRFSTLERLQKFDLSRNNIGKIPSSLFKLNTLEYLNLDFNQISKIPSDIEQLSSLRFFSINYNQFDNIPECIGDLNSLEKLYIDGNPIVTLPNSLLNLDSLKMLAINPAKLDNSSQEILEEISKRGVFICKPPYTFRFFFDAGTAMLWANDKNTSNRFGSPADPEKIPIQTDIVLKLYDLYFKRYKIQKEKKEAKPSNLLNLLFATIKEAQNQLGNNFKLENKMKKS